MSLSVKHLNGDTTFLLTFSPNDKHDAPRPSNQYQQLPGSFTILIDPWLTGSCSMLHPKFLLSRHTRPSSIKHLSEIPEPNVVLVSQDKPDHCHEPTLRQLDHTSPISVVLAEPSAAKRIRAMKHFDPGMVHELRPFSHKSYNSVIRFCVPPIVPGGTAGEVTISFIPGKMDIAGVHNATAFTYRPPSTTSIPMRPLSPPTTSPYQSALQAQALHSRTVPNVPLTPPDSPQYSSRTNTTATTTSSNPSSSFSSSHHGRSISSASSMSSSARYSPYTEKSLSVIYSPHGVTYGLIHDYASHHLVPNAALPLTLLLHSFDRVNNPWWMGGNVAAGLPGGAEIATNLMAKCWISAHDEDKDNTGLSVANVTKKKYDLKEVTEFMVRRETRVVNLGVGEEMLL